MENEEEIWRSRKVGEGKRWSRLEEVGQRKGRTGYFENEGEIERSRQGRGRKKWLGVWKRGRGMGDQEVGERI